MAHNINSVPGVKDVKYIEASFDEIVSAFISYKIKGKKAPLDLLSAEEFARKRIKYGNEHFLSTNSSWIKEGVLYVPNSDKKRYLIKNSLVLKYPKEATNAHRTGKEFSVDEDIAIYIQNGFALIDLSPIPTNRLGEDERTVQLFGDIAQDYGLFLRDSKVEQMPLRFDNNSSIGQKSGPYANQLWLGSLCYKSDFNGYGRYLYVNDRAFGVLLSAAGANAKKLIKVLPYTQKDVKKALNLSQGVKNGVIPASKLENVIKLLEKLKR